MSAPKNGGPAFPRIRSHVDTFGFLHQESDGMSRRDYMAAAIMAGLSNGISGDIAAVIAVSRADALIAELSK